MIFITDMQEPDDMFINETFRFIANVWSVKHVQPRICVDYMRAGNR